MRRPTIFTPEAFDEIKTMVAQGLDKQLIADRIGCKLGSLKVVCSNKGISLRHPDRKPGPPKGPPKPVPPKPAMMVLKLSISQSAMLRLQRHAADKGLTATRLATNLLEIITVDQLYDAVLDDRQPVTDVSPCELRRDNVSVAPTDSGPVTTGT